MSTEDDDAIQREEYEAQLLWEWDEMQRVKYEDSMRKWAEAYDDLNGAPENDEDR